MRENKKDQAASRDALRPTESIKSNIDSSYDHCAKTAKVAEGAEATEGVASAQNADDQDTTHTKTKHAHFNKNKEGLFSSAKYSYKRMQLTHRSFIAGIVIGLIAFLALNSCIHHAFSGSGQKTEINITVLKERLEKNNELSTAQYLYTDTVAVVDTNTLSLLGLQDVVMPFSGSTYILTFDGTIKAGFNLSEATVNQDGSTVTVTLPAPTILSHETGDVTVQFEQQSILNPLHIGEESSWISERKAEMEARAIQVGLLEEAQKNAQVSLASLLEESLPEGTKLIVNVQNNA